MKKTNIHKLKNCLLLLAIVASFSFFGIKTAEASYGGLIGVVITGQNQLTATFIKPIGDYSTSTYTNLGLGLLGRNITDVVSTTSDSVTLSFDGPPVAPNTTGSIDVGSVPWADNSGSSSGGTGYPVEDGIPPHLGVVTLQDLDNSGTLTASDTLSFRFNEPMTENITTDNIDSYLPLNNGHTYGTAANGLALSWNNSSTTLTVTIPTDSTIASGDTVTPSSDVQDISDNSVFQPVPVTIPVTATTPRTLYFNAAADSNWTNVNNWWNDASDTVQAVSIPDAYDDVVIQAPVYPDMNLSNDIYVNSATFVAHIPVNGFDGFDQEFLSINAANGITVNDGWSLDGAIIASTTFNGFSAAGLPYSLESSNQFYFGLSNIVGDTAFNATSTANYGTIIGNTTFHGDYGNAGLIYGNVEFNDETSNPGYIYGNAIFRDGAFNGNFGPGIITGNADVYYPAQNPLQGSVDGTITYHGYLFDGGTGTSQDPYQISTCQELQNMNNDPSASYELTADVDCSESAGWNANPDEWVDGTVGGTLIPDSYASTTHTTIIVANNGYYGFEPVGSSTAPFFGTFNGNEHTISNLWIFRKSDSNIGLFGDATGATIENLTLSDSNIVGGQNTGGIAGLASNDAISNINLQNNMVRAYLNVSGGGLVGYLNTGSINHVQNIGGHVHGSGNVIGGIVGEMVAGTISDSSSSATVDGGLSIGGFVGEMDGGTITNSHATGAVTSNRSEYVIMKSGFFTGGFVGYMDNATITNAYATGNATSSGDYGGGFVGLAGYGSTISQAYSTGNVSGVEEDFDGNVFTPQYIGGFAGYAGQASLSQTFATGNVSSVSNYVGGYSGYLYDNTIHDAYSTGSAMGYSYVGSFAGYADSSNTIVNAYAVGAVTGTDPTTNAGFVGIADSGISVSNSFWDTQTVDQPTFSDQTERTTAQLKDSTTFTNAGWDFSTIWGQSGEINSGYPTFLYLMTPTVSSTDPVDGATNVSTTTPFTVNFSTPIDTTSVSISTSTCGYACIPFSQGWSNNNQTLTLTNTGGPLAYDSLYTISVATASSVDGLLLAEPYTWSFTTASPTPPVIAPAVIATPPHTDSPTSGGSVLPAYWSTGSSNGSVSTSNSSSNNTSNSSTNITTSSTSTTASQNSLNIKGSTKFMNNLILNSNNTDVKELQKYLNAHGFIVSKSGPGSLGNETTKFGSATRAALIKFQKANRISPAVGYFGPVTRAFVNKGL